MTESNETTNNFITRKPCFLVEYKSKESKNNTDQ